MGVSVHYRGSIDDPTRIEDDEEFEDPTGHPLQERTRALLLRLHEVAPDSEGKLAAFLDTLHRGALEMGGGLAQALGADIDQFDLGLSLVQLKRALRGAAFARGALFPLRHEGLFDELVFHELHDTIEQIETDILRELHRVRALMQRD